jgi:hypothetical protein
VAVWSFELTHVERLVRERGGDVEQHVTYTGTAVSHLFTVTSATKTGTATAVITAGAVAPVKVVNGTTAGASEVAARR